MCRSVVVVIVIVIIIIIIIIVFLSRVRPLAYSEFTTPISFLEARISSTFGIIIQGDLRSHDPSILQKCSLQRFL
jgi:hypothetical protein